MEAVVDAVTTAASCDDVDLSTAEITLVAVDSRDAGSRVTRSEEADSLAQEVVRYRLDATSNNTDKATDLLVTRGRRSGGRTDVLLNGESQGVCTTVLDHEVNIAELGVGMLCIASQSGDIGSKSDFRLLIHDLLMLMLTLFRVFRVNLRAHKPLKAGEGIDV